MMIHPSYKEMIAAVNSEIEDGTVPVVSQAVTRSLWRLQEEPAS